VALLRVPDRRRADRLGDEDPRRVVPPRGGVAGGRPFLTQAHKLLHGEETDGFGDAGYQGVDKRDEATDKVNWHVAMRPGKRKALDLTDPAQAITDKIERIKASIRAKVEHPFRVIKKQFGHVKVRYRGLAKNTAQLMTLFMLSNLWMVRSKLMAGAA
jgi:IS5 family transposase